VASAAKADLPYACSARLKPCPDEQFDSARATRSRAPDETIRNGPLGKRASAAACCAPPTRAEAKRDSSTAWPGASRKRNNAGHFARNDLGPGEAMAALKFAGRMPALQEVRGGWATSRQALVPGTTCRATTKTTAHRGTRKNLATIWDASGGERGSRRRTWRS
jgi:hypothetical protein